MVVIKEQINCQSAACSANINVVGVLVEEGEKRLK